MVADKRFNHEEHEVHEKKAIDHKIGESLKSFMGTPEVEK
jgi:hypothetical protein